MNFNIDVVIPWVDSNDPIWREEKAHYTNECVGGSATDASDSRYRDWDTVKYLFRSIEMYMPWVRYVFFITYGHLPVWMNTENSKLKIIKHTDYIPSKYLPTFCSHTIELNIHRIEGLSENFIYLNDDIIILKELKETDFFRNGLPCDYAILNPINCTTRFSVQDIALTDMEVINDNFNKSQQVKNNLIKWISPCYGSNLFRSFCLMSWPHFVGFLSKHQGNAFLKSTFEEVWEKEYSILDTTCSHKFRTRRDVNQWLMRYWQLASGRFEPIKPYGQMFSISNNNSRLFDAIKYSKDKTICINDNNLEMINDFHTIKCQLDHILESRYPKKSKFET